jgi:hypothetical protein
VRLMDKYGSDKKENDSAKHESGEVLQEMLDRFEAAKSYFSGDYNRNREDVEFTLGDQWPEGIRSQRASEGRPCLTENRMLPFVHQVVNSIRQARPSLMVKPVDSGADVETAEIYSGIIRNIQNACAADTAYDKAAENAVMAGYGWIRICTDYADDDTFDQEIKIERVINPFSVYIDPNSIEQDASDAEYVFVFDDMNIEAFKKAYPDAIAEGFDATDNSKEWLTDERIRVVEYFYKDYETKTLVKTDFGRTGYKNEIELYDGEDIIDTRKVSVCKIKHCKATAVEILEETTFAGKYIPIVPVLGFETFLDGRRTVYSLVHQAKDPQRMFNFWKTASTEIIALQPKAPWVGAKGQFSNPQKWQTANRINHAYLEYEPKTIDGQLAPPPQRQAPPTSSGTMLQEAMLSADGIKSSLGMYDASMGQNTPDISGKAIISRQMQGDNATFHFVDNLSVAMRHVGRIVVGLIPVIYSGKRVMRILGEDGTEKMMPLNQPVVRVKDGFAPANADQQPDGYYMLDAGKYDVVVEVGASYATRRQEAANAIIEIGRAVPAIYEIAGDLMVKSLDIPYASEIAERMRTTMSPSLLGDDLEAQRMQELTGAVEQLQAQLAEADAALAAKRNDENFKNQIALGKLENERKDLEIKAMETAAKVDQIYADINKTNAEANTQIPAEAMKDYAEAVQNMGTQVSDIMEAMELLISEQEAGIDGATSTPDVVEVDVQQ